jgi:DNA repair protein RadC
MSKEAVGQRIKDLPAELRPRERLIKYGSEALSEIELLAILLGAGFYKTNVLNVAAEILTRFPSMHSLVDASVEELSETKGVGLAKACQVKAALELSKRFSAFQKEKEYQISSPEDAAELVKEKMRCLDREHFWALLLNTKNRVITIDEVSVGTLNSSSVHPRELFRNAIKRSAAAIILVHNHPSGNTRPSKEDIDVTRRICKVGRLVGIDVLDHLIIGDNKFISLKSEGLM